MELFEALKRKFYSDKEAQTNIGKSNSQTSMEKDVEVNYIQYDPFNSYTSQNLTQNQIALQKIEEMNNFIRKWREISQYTEVEEALSEIISESVVFDELDDPIEVDLDDVEMPDTIKKKISTSFEKIMYMLNFKDIGDDLFRQWYVDGQLNMEVVFDNANMKKGIEKLILLSPFNFFKIQNKKDNQYYYFYNNNPSFRLDNDFEKSDKVFKEEQVIKITTGNWSIDKKLPLSPLNKALKPINQLYLIEDSLVIYRITKAPEKRVFYIDTGRMPKNKAEQYVKSLISKYRQKKIYNVDTGDLQNKPKSISILEDFWFPTTSDGRGTKVETLQGGQATFGDLDDLNYFVEKVYKSLNVPRNRRGSEERVTYSNTVDIEKEELKFFKYILKLRKRFNQLFLELLKRDLLAQKVLGLNDWKLIKEKIKFKYANSNEFSQLKRLQILEMRMGIAATAQGMQQDRLLSKRFIWREIMMFTDTEIKELEQEIEDEKEDESDGDMNDEGGGGGFPPPKKKAVPKPDPDPEPEPEPEPASKDSKKPPVKKDVKGVKEENSNPFAEAIMQSLQEGNLVKVQGRFFTLEDGDIVEVSQLEE